MLAAVGIGISIASNASAQSSPTAQPLASPVVGQVPISSPLSTAAVDNQPRFTLVPSVRTMYDDNALRYTEVDGPRDNLRVTPGIDLNYRRLLGRVALNVSGSAGYDFNSRFRFLNQSRIGFSGSAQAPVGAICSMTLDASYDRSRVDLDDTQVAAGASSTTQVYGVNAKCTQMGGFAPRAGFTFRSLESGRTRYFNYEQYVANVGIAYAQPSIGTVTLNGTVAQLRRPLLVELTGFNDDTDVYSVSLGLNRSVSPRIRISAAGGITKANPKRAGVPSFLGASYNGQLEWLPTPRFTILGTAAREVTNQNGVSATYVIRDDYTLTARLNVSDKSRISLSGSHSHREFRGDDLAPSLLPVRASSSKAISGSYSYRLSRKLRASVGLSRRWRKADNPIYNFKSTVLTSSIGANF
ncbi:outer membrane beta-barrel protein [Novosphingobium sp. M1R2S20]|uniref:Outer membrane beta-barrel protein n=1 Tax=Novosphingobium rhizovicinum TaxID=3228928 RepID=A0ABV3RDC3_9SPHN